MGSVTNMRYVFIFSLFAVLARRRTRAHASAWGLSGGRLLGFSLIFCPAVGLQFCSARLALPDLLSCFWAVFCQIVLATLCFALICSPSLLASFIQYHSGHLALPWFSGLFFPFLFNLSVIKTAWILSAFGSFFVQVFVGILRRWALLLNASYYCCSDFMFFPLCIIDL